MNHPQSRVRALRTSKTSRLLAALAVVGAPLAVHAADIVKANNGNSLSTTASWSGAVVPGTGDVMLVNNVFATQTTAAVGANLSIAGIRVANSGAQLTIGATTNATLTLGSSGLDMGSASNNLIIASSLAAGANQSWSIGTGRALQVNGALTTGGNTVSISGAGALDLRPTVAQNWSSDVTIGNAELRINSATSQTVTLGGANTFDVFSIFKGTANIGTIGAYGVASNAGDGGTNSTITLGGASSDGLFRYTGNTASTNRTFTRDRRSTNSGIEVVTSGQTLTITGNLPMTSTGNPAPGAQTDWKFFGDGNLTLSGVISNSTAAIPDVVGFNKSGAGTLTLGGNNTFTGGITLAGGTLALGANERINNAVALSIANATFNAGTFTETLGALTVGNGSLISLGLGSVLNFADSSAATWTGSLSITGDFVSGSSVRFGTTATGLTSSQLAAILVNGYVPTIDTNGYLVVVPEPSTFAAIAGALGLGVAVRRRMTRS